MQQFYFVYPDFFPQLHFIIKAIINNKIKCIYSLQMHFIFIQYKFYNNYIPCKFYNNNKNN